MKKSLLLCIPALLLSSYVFSQQETYLEQVNLDSVKQRVASKYSKLVLKHDFPQDHQRMQELHIADYENNKELLKYTYLNDPMVKKQKIDSLTLAFEEWRENQVLTLEQAQKLWKKAAIKHGLGPDQKSIYVNYHFYRGLSNPSKDITEKIKVLSESDALRKLAKFMARQETKRVLSKCSALKDLDSVSLKYAGKELYAYLSDRILKTLDSHSVVQLERNSDKYCSYAYDIGAEKQAEIEAKNKEVKDEKFTSKAVEAGIGASVANDILGLIEKRAKDLRTREEKIKKADQMSELFENTAVKEKSEIKREFAQNLAKLIDRKQFATLFGEQFVPNVENKTREKMESLESSYELKKTQRTKIAEMMKLFYFNEEVIVAYFSFDKKLKKQKLSALRYKFEKDFKALMESFDLKVNTVKKMDKRTYLLEN